MLAFQILECPAPTLWAFLVPWRLFQVSSFKLQFIAMIKTANLVGSVSRNAGGLYESVRRLVQSIAANDMEVSVLSNLDEHTAEDVAAWAPVTVKTFRPRWHRQFGYTPEFLTALEAFGPDITHTHGLWCFPSVATDQYCRQSDTPYVISPHGMLDPWAIHHSRWKKATAYFFYEAAHLRQAACLRALCEAEARSFRAAGLKNPIAIIPNGIDLPQLRVPSSELPTPPWSALCPPASGRKVLLYLGRIHPKKGLMNLLRAWSSILHSQPSILDSWCLAIAGWDQGGHEAKLKTLATELGIPWSYVRGDGKSDPSSILHPPSSLLFLGPQFNAAKAACYANCDAFILPSFSEGVPMVVLEAWAYAKPVLMTPECNLPAGFAAGAAIRIETNPESIVQGLQELLHAPRSTLHALGANGRQLVAEKFAWPVLGRDMAGLYRWILGGGDRPRCLMDD